QSPMISIMKKHSYYLFLLASILYGCSPTAKISKFARQNIIGDSALKHANVGIAIYEPEKHKYIYRNNADRYFIPASNVKIFSCYVGMKYLGDQVPGILYAENDTALFLVPTGDPTFLHSAFQSQPVAAFIRDATKKIYINTNNWKTEKYGPGWSWDDYNDDYMAERSPMPIYGNIIKWYQVKSKKEEPQSPSDTIDTFIYSDPEMDGSIDFGKPSADGRFRVSREWSQNNFTLFEGKEKNAMVETPFVTNGIRSALQLIKDSLHKELIPQDMAFPESIARSMQPLYSRPLDSLLKRMMYYSDNLFAEQVILMSSMMQLGVSNADLFLEHLLSKEFAALPDKPRWVDGSGLSRYNLFSPQDMVWILDKINMEIPWKRIETVFATGGKGTLSRSFAADSTLIYAKTGTLSGVSALSGYIQTRKKRKLIFSIMINNHNSSSALIRNRFADLLHECMKYY
ncbi:MAG: D-alanyl-D-alanine carboxypeptidase/D-alanyl-D-alanine endopeptidase, partial [Chitinophagaceae bacterium]